jgi:beta-N-acetylhexosaminidase
MVAVDQEGGRVARLREPWAVWPAARAVGPAGRVETARRLGLALAEQLSASGIRWNIAPCVDVDTNPKNTAIGDRSFGDDPDLVARLGAATIEGLQAGGVAACAKHFPGHGDTEIDPHLELPAVDHPRSRLDEIELRPFRKAIETGVASVMTSHILVRELDAERPATLSPAIIEGLLRKELGFAGVIVTDDLAMGAVARHWTPAQIALLAAQAGCDVLELCKGHDAQVEAIESLIRAHESGAVPFKDAEAAFDRVRRLKERFLTGAPEPDPKRARVVAESLEHRALAEAIATGTGIPA